MMRTTSYAALFQKLTATERRRRLATLTPAEQAALRYAWWFWARPEQLPPAGNWTTWLLMAGRGFGKTRTAAEWIRARVATGAARRVALVADTAADVRDVMVEGPSGILAISPPAERPIYEPSKRRLTWPNGAVATTYSAEEPDQLRGPEHDAAWSDELAKWGRSEAWDNLLMGLRYGPDPRVLVSTTPRPTPALRALIAAPSTIVTRGSTHANRDNLPAEYFARVVAQYEGTRLGRQELYAELLTDTPGALWTGDGLQGGRVLRAHDLTRVVVGVDPAVSGGDDGDETGIVVAGLGADGHGYVLEDASLRASPDAWARAVIAAFDRHNADRIVVETNQGGAMAETLLRTIRRTLPITGVHARQAKRARAEPVAALYEQGTVHHVGQFAALEDQMTTWLPGHPSPDRMDALVHALTDLMIRRGGDYGVHVTTAPSPTAAPARRRYAA